MAMKNANIPPHPSVTHCEDGKLCWRYTLNLWRHPVMLYTVFKAMSVAAAGYPGTMGVAAAGQSFYLQFSEVKVVKAVRKQNLIRANSRFVRNRIYAAPEQFDFMRQYIVSHCQKGKIYE